MNGNGKWKCWLAGLAMLLCIAIAPGCSNDGDDNGGVKPDLSGKQSEFYTASPESGMVGTYGNEDGQGEGAPAPTDSKDDASREIEEADIIRIEGSNLYILNQYRGFTVCDISNPDQPSISGRCPIEGYPIEMYIRDNRAYVLVSEPQAPVFGVLETGMAADPESFKTKSRVDIIDISSAANPAVSGSHEIDGTVTDSRIVGDILYVVSAVEPVYWAYADGEADSETRAEERNVYVASIDVSVPSAMNLKDRVDFGGGAQYIHVTGSAIFISDHGDYNANGSTGVVYVDISDPAGAIETRGKISLPGRVEDEFKMDYANGYLRVCTYQWADGGLSYLFVVDTADPDNLVKVSQLELAQGEQLFAARFDGNKAYMVTYERKDPLWVIDLSDPADPRITGELIVPGWSTHIEPKGDHLVALGVDDTDGNKVAVSLFDVSDPADPSLIERVSFGDGGGWSSSSAYNDVKSFTIMDDIGLILLPYNFSSYTDGRYSAENRLQLIDYSPADLNPRGWVRQKGSVLRGRMHADRIYSVSADELQVIDASNRDNPGVTASLSLARNAVDFTPLENGYGVQLTESGGRYQFRCVPLSDPEEGRSVSEMDIDIQGFPQIFVNGNLLYVVTSEFNAVYGARPESAEIMPYPESGVTTVRVIDYTNPASPVKRGSIELPGEFHHILPYAESGLSCPYYFQRSVIQAEKDLLVFAVDNDRYYPPLYETARAPEGDDEPGGTPPENEEPPVKEDPDEPSGGLILVDLSNPGAPKIASEFPVSWKNASGVFANHGMICYSFYEEADADAQGRPRKKYYLGRVDISDPAAPVLLPAVNTPGNVLNLDDSGDYGYTVNREWKTGDTYEYTLNTVFIENDEAFAMGSVDLESEYVNFMVEDGLVYASAYSYFMGNTALSIIDVSDPERPEFHENVFEKSVSGVIGARDRKVFVNGYKGLACYSVADPANPALTDFRSGIGWANNLSFSDRQAFIPLGYYGLWTVDL